MGCCCCKKRIVTESSDSEWLYSQLLYENYQIPYPTPQIKYPIDHMINNDQLSSNEIYQYNSYKMDGDDKDVVNFTEFNREIKIHI